MKLDQLIDIVMGNIFEKYIMARFSLATYRNYSKTKFDESIVFYSSEGVHRDNQKQLTLSTKN